MEFSFDRSRDGNLNNSNTTNTGSNAGASRPQAQGFGGTSQVRSGPDINSQDPSTIANERLRKAIERNRAKQAEREAQRGTTQANPSANSQASSQHFSQRQTYTPPPRPEMKAQPRQTVEAEEYAQESFFSQAAQETMSSARMNARAQEAEQARESIRENTRENIRATRASAPKAATTAVVSRRSVAKPDSTEFVPVKRTSRKVSSHVSYTTSSTRKKTKSLNPKYADYLIKGCWIFCAVMVLRLIFAAGGVTSFYSQKNVVKLKQNELMSIKKENMLLVREIERMKSDIGYQKRLVRDNLGFIARDEFLVLFPKEK